MVCLISHISVVHLFTDALAVDAFDPQVEANTFAGALKLYLRELPEPVFTYDLYNDFIIAGST